MGILLGSDTRVVVHGITGRQASADLPFSIAYGTKVLAGVAPGHGGEAVEGVPVYNSTRDAVSAVGPVDLSVQYVPARDARAAVVDALDAGVKVVQLIAEGIPQRDVSHICAAAKEHGAVVNGPNSNGILTVGEAKVGIIGNAGWVFSPGVIGVASRSGGMTHEVSWELNRASSGVSTALSIGGDPMVGLSFRDVVELFDDDDATEGIVLVCDPGGVYELELIEWLPDRLATKPIVALLLGYFLDDMPRGAMFGHAGALIEDEHGRPIVKRRLLESAGIQVAETPEELAAVAVSLVAAQGR